jgi:hypothetical protein
MSDNNLLKSTVGNWIGADSTDLNGAGLTWSYADQTIHLMYRTGDRIWSNGHFDLDANRSYHIDNNNVLSVDSLGPTVTQSSLRQVGVLRTLRVAGDTALSDYAFVNETRLGLGTSSPNAALGILDNNIEIVLGSETIGTAKIGTYTNDSLDIVTDNTARISVGKTGEVTIGHPEYKNGVLRVNGTLYVNELVAESRLTRSSSLHFETKDEDTFYGKGIEWIDSIRPRQLICLPNPDRIYSTEVFELAETRWFSIGGNAVLSVNALGETVTESSLNKVGILRDLTVSGPLQVTGETELDTVLAKQINLTDGATTVSLNKNGINFGNAVAFTRSGEVELGFDATGISIGNSQNLNRPVRVFGKLSVGVNNPDPTVGLAIAGNLSFSDKKFITGNSAPVDGNFKKGDICWNTDPITASYIGWVCVVAGTPGQWKPFGLIA